MGAVRQAENPYEPRNMGMAMDSSRRTPLRATLDDDTASGVGLHSGHIDALMRGEWRAGRGHGFAEGQEDSRAEWPVAWERGWRDGAREGEQHVLTTLGESLGSLQEDVAVAVKALKKKGDKTTRAELIEELETIETAVGKIAEQARGLAENITT